MVGRQTQRHERQTRHIERAVVRIPVGRLWLRAAEANGEESTLVVVLLVVIHAVHHLRQRGAHLSVREVLRQLLIPRHQGQRLHGCHAIRRGASDNGERAFGRDEALEDDGMLLRTLQRTVVVLLIVESRVCLRINHVLQRLQIHGMEHIRRVVVEGEHGAIGIPAVAHIPLFHLANGCHHAIIVVFLQSCSLCDEALDSTREEEPVGVGRLNLAQHLELLDVALLRHLVEWHPKGVVGTDERLSNVSGIHEVLSAHTPAEVVGRGGVYGVLERGQCPLAQLATLLALGGVVVGQREPRCQTSHQPTERLHVDHLPVSVVERR